MNSLQALTHPLPNPQKSKGFIILNPKINRRKATIYFLSLS